MRHKKYGRVRQSYEWVKSVRQALPFYLDRLAQRQKGLKKFLKEEGVEHFTWVIANVLNRSVYREEEFEPTPSTCPELYEELKKLKSNGHVVDGLRVSLMGDFWEPQRLRIEIPPDADPKKYLRAIRAYQEHFKSRFDYADALSEHLADEHGKGRTCKELADEINAAIVKNDSQSELGWLIQEYKDSKRRGRKLKPEDFVDAESVRRLIKYYWSKPENRTKMDKTNL